jgi:hypothetical protein
MNTATRDMLIRDIEEQCPTILQPSETSKMRARKLLVYAREAMERFFDHNRMIKYLQEAKEMYNRVCKDLNEEDLHHMIEGFRALQTHEAYFSALQVLLKRCSEKEWLDDNEVMQLYYLIIHISKFDRSVFERALNLCLEHRGLYIFKVTKKTAAGDSDVIPAIDYVLAAVILTTDYVSLWPILRRQDCLRRQTDAHERLVEFLKSKGEWDKLVDFYNEIGQFAQAQEMCEHQAYLAHTEKVKLTLDDRIYWFRQAAKAASLGGRGHKQKDFEFRADLCEVQKRLYHQTGVCLSLRVCACCTVS